MNILEIRDLDKSFGTGNKKVKAVDNASFDVKSGEIVGFVGPNGSGKTTTLKMVANLIWPDKGSIVVGGHDLFKEREKALACMAGIVENPGLYQNISGMANLKFIQGIRKVSKSRLDECIEISGLGKHLRRKVQEYSLGMKQRLALAMSLLTNPKLLILDEPTNGLDPTGILELREMLTAMKEAGEISLLFSSHKLGEVEKISDRIVYIRKGRIIKVQEGSETHLAFYTITTQGQSKEALDVLQPIQGIKTELIDEQKIRLTLEELNIGNIIDALKAANIGIVDIEKRQYDLEAVYEELYRNKSKGVE
ncbi:MAG: ABC transporter ATP-binding protein [Clostridiales bacterium]|jgi:ABC-2 type transport system ATP-binding protein|nr:ABC transporter ATP-binding protein [Clostridiales bacterium]